MEENYRYFPETASQLQISDDAELRWRKGIFYIETFVSHNEELWSLDQYQEEELKREKE